MLARGCSLAGPVNVYRLIHEDTLEEKIVERAERKLFLDRLIIEQGRLAMMMPSLQTGELQQMIRFGADVIIKSEGTSLTDADIDVIISQGESRTKEIAAKLKVPLLPVARRPIKKRRSDV